MSLGAWTILVVLLSLLAATGLLAYLGWTLGSDAEVPASGYAAMGLGVIVSLGVGFGLMALVFYSSRKGYDEPPVLLAPSDRDQDADQPAVIDDGATRIEAPSAPNPALQPWVSGAGQFPKRYPISQPDEGR